MIAGTHVRHCVERSWHHSATVPISLSLDPQWSQYGRRIGPRLVQVRPEDTNSCLTVLSHAVTMYPERSGRGPRLELPQIAVANKLALSSASFPSTDALILPPILYLWCARDFPTAPCERVLYCAVLVHSCKHGLVILYQFSTRRRRYGGRPSRAR